MRKYFYKSAQWVGQHSIFWVEHQTWPVDLCAALAETSSGVNSQDMTKNSPKTDEMNKEKNTEDDMKGAIEWAKHQKQSLLNKK